MSIETILVSALVGIITSGITAYVTTGLRMREEKQKWRREFTEKYAEVRSRDSTHAEMIAVQFGIGVLKFRTRGQSEPQKKFLPPNSRLVAGRGADNDFVLVDPKISRQHSAFFTDDSEVYIEDLGSMTGTLLNGERIKGRTRIKTGDVITIGDTEFLFHRLDAR